LTVSLDTRCRFATCSIGVDKSSFDANLNRLLSDVSSQPESKLNTEKNSSQSNKSNLTVLVYSLSLNLREIENISDIGLGFFL